ncbi:MAG TPA: tol-pal system protein YbgF, partial [Nitrospiria bacterium]|nr:tol-pal system protein YbgF [Nitrospiria bacterium]
AAAQKKLGQDMASLQVKLDQHPAPAAGEAPAAAELTTQYDQLQNDLKTLKGQMEETNHAIGEIRQHLDDQGFQLSTLTAQMQTLQTAVAGAMPPAAGAPPPPVAAAPDQKLVLPGRMPAPKTGAVTPVEAYNLAYNDYLRGNYTLAVNGFEQFLQQYPSSILVPHAMYWLGESYFGAKQYQKAAGTFEQFMQRYPKHEKVPAAMLKNGLAYLEIGDKQQASQLLKRLVANYPTSDEANVAKGRLAEIR